MAKPNRYHTNKDDAKEDELAADDKLRGQIQPNPEDFQRFIKWYGNYRELKSYKEVREDLAWIKWGVAHGLIDTKVANCQCYLMSHVLIALDRERQFDTTNDQANKFFVDNQMINLTVEQAARVLQESRMAMQAKLIVQFQEENTARANNLRTIGQMTDHIQNPVVDAVVREIDERDYVF
jgi:hypothetical protein